METDLEPFGPTEHLVGYFKRHAGAQYLGDDAATVFMRYLQHRAPRESCLGDKTGRFRSWIPSADGKIASEKLCGKGLYLMFGFRQQ